GVFCLVLCVRRLSFVFTATSTAAIYTLSLHDALPIWVGGNFARSLLTRSRAARSVKVIATIRVGSQPSCNACSRRRIRVSVLPADRKSTRLNSSHVKISYAVFCLKKKKSSLLHDLFTP